MAFVGEENLLWKELAAITRDEGLRLYDLDRCSASLLRVYVDREGGGVTSGDCSRMVRRLMVYCLAEGPRLGLGVGPEIEVSSPGINRQLRRREHFLGAVGQRVHVIPREESGQRAATGVLREVCESTVEVIDETSREAVVFPLGEIKRANVDYKFS